MPTHIVPMLAQIGKGTPPSGPDWLYEIKWDGVRAICYIQDGRVRLVSRNGNFMERQYPELSVLPHHIKASNAILDGEIAALDHRQRFDAVRGVDGRDLAAGGAIRPADGAAVDHAPQ